MSFLSTISIDQYLMTGLVRWRTTSICTRYSNCYALPRTPPIHHVSTCRRMQPSQGCRAASRSLFVSIWRCFVQLRLLHAASFNTSAPVVILVVFRLALVDPGTKMNTLTTYLAASSQRAEVT